MAVPTQGEANSPSPVLVVENPARFLEHEWPRGEAEHVRMFEALGRQRTQRPREDSGERFGDFPAVKVPSGAAVDTSCSRGAFFPVGSIA